MGKGYLKVQTFTANGGVIVGDVSITVMDENDNVLYEVQTDNMGMAMVMELKAPDKKYVEEPNPPVKPYSTYRLIARAPGFTTVLYEGVMIFDSSTSILNIEMDPVVLGQELVVERRNIEGHKLYETTEPQQVQVGGEEELPRARILPEVTIPNFIRVHLGREENTAAPTVSVPYLTYIKNVASHEIFDEWPEQAIIANVYCIVSFTLNRVYTEFYRKRGKNYHLTSETFMDQKYVHNGIIGARISAVVDRIYNYYLAIIGHKEPFLSLYNDGIRVNIPGRLSQWGSFYDARDRGMVAWQIVTKYFSQNLELRICDNFGGVLESYPGYTLTQGSRGDAVRTMQLYLNRILGRYTNIIINPVDGVFGPQTTNSVRIFQQLYNIPQTGNIDRRTWYEISRIYAIERALWEMYSEGQRIGIGRVPPTRVTRLGDQGALVVELQFLLDFIAMYHNEIPFVAQTSRFDQLTDEGVRAFQRLFNITVDGVVGATTWRKLYDVYWGIIENTIPPQPPINPYPPEDIPPFPGVSMRVGSTGAGVRMVQEAINKLAPTVPGMWQITVDGIFGNNTRDAVMAFQRIFGLVVDGIVGPITWNRLMQEANITAGTPQIPPFPGTNLSVGSTGANVRLIQEAINTLAPLFPGRLWRLTVDGIYGNMTRDAIYAFQSIFNLPLTGVVNEATWNLLMTEAASVAGGGGGGGTPPPPAFPGTNISMGATGPNVRLIQEAINTIAPNFPGRLWILNVDGVFGPMTRDAIFSFQSVFGMPITGVVNEATWNRLMQEAANVRGTAQAVMPVNENMNMPGVTPGGMQENIQGNMPGSMSENVIGNMPERMPEPNHSSGMVETAPAVPEHPRYNLRPMDGMKPVQPMDREVQKPDLQPAVEVMTHSTTTPVYDSLPYGTGVAGTEPLGMKFSENVADRHGYGHDHREYSHSDRMPPRRDYDYDYRERRHSDRGPDRRGYGYGYRERYYCDMRGRGDSRCGCSCTRKECRCRRKW